MIQGAVILLLGLAGGYLVKALQTKGLESKYKDTKDQLSIARQMEKEREHEPDNFYDR